jgi:hypothetical protein
MKKYIITYLLMITSVMLIGMDNTSSNKREIKKMEILRRVLRQQRNTVEMSLESSSQTDDEMSFSSSLSGSFPIPIPKEVVQEKSSNFVISKHGYSPRQRESSLKKLLQEQDAEK